MPVFFLGVYVTYARCVYSRVCIVLFGRNWIYARHYSGRFLCSTARKYEPKACLNPSNRNWSWKSLGKKRKRNCWRKKSAPTLAHVPVILVAVGIVGILVLHGVEYLVEVVHVGVPYQGPQEPVALVGGDALPQLHLHRSGQGVNRGQRSIEVRRG